MHGDDTRQYSNMALMFMPQTGSNLPLGVSLYAPSEDTAAIHE